MLAPARIKPDRLTGKLARCGCWLAAAALVCFSALAARAQTGASEKDIKALPGRDVRVAIYVDIKPDCTSGPLPAIRLLVPPAHGTVSVKRATLKATNFKQCLATEVPAFVALYRAAKDFIGIDRFALEISSANGRKKLERFRVNISGAAGGKQGI